MSAGETKECPFCAETIKAAARGCRFCGYVFPVEGEAGASVPAMPATAAPSPPTTIAAVEVPDLLAELVAKSLVLYEEDPQGQGRYRLLETVRQYSRDRLLEAGEAEAVRGRHLAFFVTVAEEAEPELWRDAAWLERLDEEHDNLRAALEWGAGCCPEAGLRLAGALTWYWDCRLQFAHPRQQLEAALAGSASVEPSVRAKGLCAAGRAAALRGDTEEAMVLGEESLALYRQTGDRSGMGWSLLVHWQAAWNRGDFARMRAVATEALGLFREVEDVPGTAMALHMLGHAHARYGDAKSAAALEVESLALCRREGYRWFSGVPLNTLGNLALSAGQAERAAALQEEALAIWREIGNRMGIINTLNFLAQGARSVGDHTRAAALYRQSLAICRELGSDPVAVRALAGLAAVEGARGQPRRAARLFGAAEALQDALYALDRAEHDRSVAAVRAALGEEAFAAAWADGRTISLEEAVRYAMEEDTHA